MVQIMSYQHGIDAKEIYSDKIPFIREPKAIEDLVNHVATILG